MVRTDRFKYILSSSDDEAFFDLRADPFELDNVIRDPSRPEDVSRHRRMLREWMSAVGEQRLPPVPSNELAPPAKAKKAKKSG